MLGAILPEGFGIPLPGQSMLMVGAFLASRGKLNIIPLLFIAWAAAIAGNSIGYMIGRFGGRALILRYGGHVFISQKRLEYVETFFRRHGGVLVVVARFFEILRQMNGIVAGITKMPWGVFHFYNALGAALWVGFWGMLVYQMGKKAGILVRFFYRVELILLIGLAIAAAATAIYLLRRHKKSSS